MQPDPLKAAFERRKRDLFEAAMDISEANRAAFIADKTRNDPSLGEAVRRLLTSGWEESDGVLNHAVYERKSETSARMPSAIGKYAVVSHLGTGGMGSVYVCKEPGTGTQVAIKIMRSGLRTRGAREHFERERDILKRLQHPNVSRILDASVAADGTPFIVMQLVDGEPLDAFCRQKSCSVSQRLLLFSQALAGVEYFHHRDVIHRDLKPSNLFVTRSGSVQILDFGLARMIDHQKGGTGHGPTRTALPFMTIPYASPEQLSGSLSGRSSDIYSLGVICYELLTGRNPVPRQFHRNPQTMLNFISTQSPARPSQLAPGLSQSADHLVWNALQLSPPGRYGSAGLFLEDLRKYLEGSAVPRRYPLNSAQANT